MKYPILVLASLTLIAAAPAPQATALPPPPVLSPAPSASPPALPTVTPSTLPSATPTPSVLPTPTPSLDDQFGGRRRGGGRFRGPQSTPTPQIDTRKGLDGVWELQIQRGANTEYEHMDLVQKGTDLTGYYLVAKTKQKLPLTGVLDDQHNVRLVITRPDGTTILLEARVDGTTDMLGMFTDSQERVPFTAAYRAKEKFIDNINATPGGLPGAGTGGP